MTYSETINFLYNSLPVFHRVGGPAYKANLNNTLELDRYFGHPHTKFRTIHVGGTNGKGSVSHMIASVLQEAGYKTGLYTSPHLKDYRERIRVNGTPISQKDVIKFVELHKPILDTLKPSFFELSVAMAFNHFARQQVDYAVIEVGMGGRLDSTNIIIPELSIITNISLDHTQFLGKSLPEIAAEKAGIIKPGIPVIIGETHTETRDVFLARANELGSDIAFADMRYKVTAKGTLGNRQVFELKDMQGAIYYPEPDLLGIYQSKNIATVFAALDSLQKSGMDITLDQIYAGIKDAAARTGLRGRWEILTREPMLVCDTAHNEAGIKIVMDQLKLTPHESLHIVFGMVKDKDPVSIMKLLPTDAIYYFTKANIPRALDVNALTELAAGFGLKSKAFTSVKQALYNARNQAVKNDLIFVGGSTFVVAEVL